MTRGKEGDDYRPSRHCGSLLARESPDRKRMKQLHFSLISRSDYSLWWSVITGIIFSYWMTVIHRMSSERISTCVLQISKNKMVNNTWNLILEGEVDVIDFRDGFNLGPSYREHSRTSGGGWRWWWWLRFTQWKVRYRVRSIDRQLILPYSVEIRLLVNEAKLLSIAADMHTWRDWRRVTISFDLSAP